ncbi:hypothetical protein F8S13_18605 [Chloroflexia bacterium SDU3-3]|nr:hypothetical protein F8S13_18605 [Chloroflexia bacterium SDU3-3]
MDVALAGEPSTDDTLTIYCERGGPRVLTFARLGLEYDAPDIAFRTRWENLTTIYRGLWASELYMLKEPYIMRASYRHRKQLYSDGPEIPAYPSRRFALDPFGYPQNTELCADLGRRAPQLVPYLPRR